MTGRHLILALTILASAAAARAQAPPEVIAFASPTNIEFMSGPIAFDTEPVIGAPYTAEAVTDVVQTLADGNRIVRKSKAQISRDSQGRTRREQGLAMFGPVVNAPDGADQPRNVQISDPAAGTMIMLDLQTRTAHKMPAPRMMIHNKIAAVGGAVNVDKFEAAVPPVGAGALGGVMFERRIAIAGGATAATRVNEPVVEQLGTTFMEGVAVEGTRTTVTIPAGQIGNERPIEITSERWFSPDLKVLVMSKQSDPRFGETTYRLTNLTRTEPPADLFEIPPGFSVVEPPMREKAVVIENKLTQ
jgi:hypothetical protein